MQCRVFLLSSPGLRARGKPMSYFSLFYRFHLYFTWFDSEEEVGEGRRSYGRG